MTAWTFTNTSGGWKRLGVRWKDEAPRRYYKNRLAICGAGYRPADEMEKAGYTVKEVK